ncbi:uncharacterized protein LOC128546292 [Mercenaria mercenaria]|uniref:uncharacterized protein LOC128546292 n=1 Tax=Mercenaria mercenaria TaxID=6596 RepID=UPI00234F620D|nr:uncharacterized protein LOC128546292 [Mercenaria mercenaria]
MGETYWFYLCRQSSDDSSCDVVPSITTAGGYASVSLSTSHTVASATKSEEIVAPLTSDAVVSCDIDDQDQAERDMERYFQLKERKEERQKMASLIIKGQQLGAKRISVVYCSHGGIGLSMSVPPETPLKFVFDYICSNIQAEVLPPKFVLKTSDDQEYKPTDNCACGDVPGLLFIKEEVYNFDDTLTNYDEVHFMSC